jgi:hypothetical protein
MFYAGDFYYYYDQPQYFYRSYDVLVVRFAQDPTNGLYRTKSGYLLNRYFRQFDGSFLSKLAAADPSNDPILRHRVIMSDLTADPNVLYVYPELNDGYYHSMLYLSDRLTIIYKEAVHKPDEVDDYLLAHSVEDHGGLGEGIYVYRLTQPKQFDILAICRDLHSFGSVRDAEPDATSGLRNLEVPP